MDFKQQIEKGIICAEGYLFELERRGHLKAGPFVPEVVLDNPKALQQLHEEFMACGSDVSVAFTYYGHRDKLKGIGREDELESLNRQALRIARAAAGDKLCAGNICNTWVYDPNDQSTHESVRAIFDEQVRWAKEEGVDFVIAETFFYLGEALIALEVIRSHGLLAVVTLAPFHEKTADNHTWAEACRILEEKGADVVGLNCGRGPATMMPLLKDIRNTVSGHVAALPVPYSTDEQHKNFQKLKDETSDWPVNLEHFLLNRRECADFAKEAKDIGINYIGLCCGGSPHFIRTMAERLGRIVPASRYSPDMSGHAVLGDNIKEHNRELRKDWE
ncbi:MAG: homocysteine S-methyltransferase family protein [Candidatus Woesearchaeota archaeon]